MSEIIEDKPRKKPGPDSMFTDRVYLTIRVEREQRTRWGAVAKERGVVLSCVIRDMMDAWASESEEPEQCEESFA